VQVSEQAKAALAAFLEKRGEAQILRLGVANQKHTLAFDETRAGDLTFQHRGRPVLVVAAGVAPDLWGLIIDVEQGEAGLRIVLRRIADAEHEDTGRDAVSTPAVDRRSDEHRRLLQEVGAITAQIATLRLSRSADRIPRIRELEAAKQAKWHEIRVLFVAARGTSEPRAVLAVLTAGP
jgi:Fe-S cluster assembly iron-binding protein IscA